jgi:hypothetical protein
MDTTPVLQVLDKHSQFQNVMYYPNSGYYHIKVIKEKTWVPILPGYTIFTKIKNSIFQLSINVSEQKILFSWIDFGENENNISNAIASNSQPDRFQSLITYINIDGRMSIPHLFGLNIPGIVQILITAVYQRYPQLYPKFQPTFKAGQVTEKSVGVVQRKAKRLRKEVEETSPEIFIREGLLITTGETKYVKYEDFMVLLIECKQVKQLLYNANRQIKRLKQKIDAFKYEQNDIDEEEDDEIEEESLKTCVDKIIDESKLGSTILVNTKQFISLVLQQSCSYCGETRLTYKKTKITTVGFSVKILVSCQLCEMSVEFTNESLGVNLNSCVATAGLVGGINRRSLQMVFAYAGISLQLCKASFHHHQTRTFEKIVSAAGTSADIALRKVIEHHKIQGKQIIPVSFDCSWSHVRNAQQASGEIIYDGRDIDGNYLFYKFLFL